jgi:hypothetical protein
MRKHENGGLGLEGLELVPAQGDVDAKVLALLYAYWALAEALLHEDLIDKPTFFGRAAAGLDLLFVTQNLDAAQELAGIIEPLVERYFNSSDEVQH